MESTGELRSLLGQQLAHGLEVGARRVAEQKSPSRGARFGATLRPSQRLHLKRVALFGEDRSGVCAPDLVESTKGLGRRSVVDQMLELGELARLPRQRRGALFG